MRQENESKNNSPTAPFLKTDGGKTKSNAIEVPSISLPKGGGAIKGIDEKFSVNAVNGTAAFSIPLPFAPARGAVPQLNLSYNSGGGNGVFGLGWNLGLPSIRRKTDKGLPQYLDAIDSDTFLFSEAEDLVPEFQKGTDGSFSLDSSGHYIIKEKNSSDNVWTIRYYRPRIEGLFARIERWTEKATGVIRWRVISKENVTTLFGWSAGSRIADTADENRKIFEWLPEFVFDDKGNCTQYLYKKEDGEHFDASHLHHRNRRNNGKITYTNLYLEQVLYGNKTPFQRVNDSFPPPTDYLFQTVLDYGEETSDAWLEPATHSETGALECNNDWGFRPNAFSDYKSGFEIRTTRLCRRVLLYHHFTELPGRLALVKSLNFEYDTKTEQDFTFLKSITAFGYIKKLDNGVVTYTKKNLPPTEFEYQKHDWNKTVKTISTENLVHAPSGLDESQYQFTDLFNEGLSGILTEQANGWYYKHNLGNGNFEHAKLVSPKPSFSGLGNGALQLADLDADGGKQLASFNGTTPGYFELDEACPEERGNWQRFRSFESLPSINFGDAQTRMLDLNGDGKPEVVMTEDNVFTWYESAGRKGFSQVHKTVKPIDEEKGAAIVFADAKQTIFLADMSGDGLTDLVRIRNGEVCYWPNLGYGKFGAKVAMDDAPVFDHPDTFNPAFLQLADIDGSGTTDLIYLGKNKFSCWLNLSGNGFSKTSFDIGAFPEVHQEAKITVTDLLGNGVACIVWSSPLSKDAHAPLRYIDLMNSTKPHIMVRYKNNLGKEVSMEYTPSTKFYIQDKLAGRPWVTKLHFPVHCISKTETRDTITGARFVSSYQYHHGYYDHAEREFRGFGLVEQTDAEHFEHWIQGAASNVVGRELHQEPVLTKNWVHTGAFLSREKILTQFAHEYWYEEMARQGFPVTHHEQPLPDARIIAAPGLPASVVENLSAEEWQQALRACKSMALRSEVFAKDAPLSGATDDERKRELTPYSVATHNCVIQLLQPKGRNRHAVFVVLESEALTFSYERKPEDPRIAHTMNLEIDQYANVKKAVSIVYGRKTTRQSVLPNYDFKEAHQLILDAEQRNTHVVLTENGFTNDLVQQPNVYRLPLPYEVKTYECTGLIPDARTGYFELAAIKSAVESLQPLAYYDASTAGGKRLIEHVQTLYRSDDLAEALPPGVLQSLALPWESYQLAFTPKMLDDLYGNKLLEPIRETVLVGDGKYEKPDHTNYWISSGKPLFSADASDMFYLPVGYEDPFLTTTHVEYDLPYFLAIKKAILAKDTPLETVTEVVGFDYRTLSPVKMKDINANFSEVVTDELGMVVATAVYEKDRAGGPGEGDSLEGGDWIFDQARINLFFGDPHGQASDLLGNATSCLIYDLDRSEGQPTRVATISRETHFRVFENGVMTNPATNYQIGIEYSDGLGNVALKKVQAEPGTGSTYARWIGNGRTVLNNKGKPVKQYEPYFSDTQHYESETELSRNQGVTSILYYDAVGRNIKTNLPDGTFTKVEFDAWEQRSFDQNDTIGTRTANGELENTCAWYDAHITSALDTEQQAAQKAAFHADTPSIVYLDSLGRPFFSIAHNKWIVRGDISRPEREFEAFYATYAELDVEGNVHKIKDARDNTVMTYQYDMLGHLLVQSGMDNGWRWMLNDCMGKPMFVWDSRNHLFRTTYDALHRPLKIEKTDYTDRTNPLTVGNWHTLEIMEYGKNTAEDREANRNGALKTHFDSTGIVVLHKNDFKGNPLDTERRYCRDHSTMPNWSHPVSVDDDAHTWHSSTRYDALNRPTAQIAPHLGTAPTNTVFHEFDRSGALQKVEAILQGSPTRKVFVKNIIYNEKGQRTSIDYGNHTRTRYEYNPDTYRLTRLMTVNTNRDGADNGKIYQDLNYTYDPVGNITNIRDAAQQTIYFNNEIVEPACAYEYDALYRLIHAEGREHIGQLAAAPFDNWNDAPKMNQPSPSQGNAMRRYIQQYAYDAVGNFLEIRHRANGGSWTRHYRNDTGSNRLLKSWVGDDENRMREFTYDAHGSMTSLPHLHIMAWNCKDQLEMAARMVETLTDDEKGDTYHFQYDAAGQRSRKVTALDGRKKQERLYMGGFEIYRKYGSNGVSLARETLHIMDDTQRIAMVETRTVGTDNTEQVLVRYQYGNHLGSASLEMDDSDTPRVISYEEYHPYGTTAYHAQNGAIRCAAKRYRYTGMERDEETGLEYHSARYYLPWLGRWMSADNNFRDGLNLFIYVKNSPTNYMDMYGEESSARDDSGLYDKESSSSSSKQQRSRSTRRASPPPSTRSASPARPTSPPSGTRTETVALPDGQNFEVRYTLSTEGITFSANSRLSAQQLYALIQADQRLHPILRRALRVEDNTLFIDNPAYGPSEFHVPEWFRNAQIAANTGKWEFTTAAINETGSGGSVLVPDLPRNDPIGSRSRRIPVPPIPGQDNWLPNRAILELGGVTAPIEGHGSPTADDRNVMRNDPIEDSYRRGPNGRRGIVAVANRVGERPESDQLIVRNFFHELGLHAGRLEQGLPWTHDSSEVNELERVLNQYFSPQVRNRIPLPSAADLRRGTFQ